MILLLLLKKFSLLSRLKEEEERLLPQVLLLGISAFKDPIRLSPPAQKGLTFVKTWLLAENFQYCIPAIPNYANSHAFGNLIFFGHDFPLPLKFSCH